MYARIARFEGLEANDIDGMVAGVKRDVESGERPPGLEDSKGVLILVDRERGTSLGIVTFSDEEGMKRGDAALNEMSPDSSSGSRSSVEMYEIAFRHEED
jgi:hypothetical protein